MTSRTLSNDAVNQLEPVMAVGVEDYQEILGDQRSPTVGNSIRDFAKAVKPD